MTLDEAIKHCEEVAKANDKGLYDTIALGGANPTQEEIMDCEQCAADHNQLAEWLKELKERRSADAQFVDKWIKICDKLPETNKNGVAHILVYDKYDGVVSAEFLDDPANYVGGSNVFIKSNSSAMLHKVTHWQPLPEPPEMKKG